MNSRSTESSAGPSAVSNTDLFADLFTDLAPELDAGAAPPLDRFCDLVLQGGVIDGIVYPGVLTELARHFRFHSLGGTSVGALAASLAAACEYRRRYGSLAGFNEGLRKLPQELAQWVGTADAVDAVDAPHGLTVLGGLFQAKPEFKPLLALILDIIEALSENPPATTPTPSASTATNAATNTATSAAASTAASTAAPPGTACGPSPWGLRPAWAAYQNLRPLLWRHFPPSTPWKTFALLLGCQLTAFAGGHPGWGVFWGAALGLTGLLVAHLSPLLAAFKAVRNWSQTPGHGLCTGLRSPGHQHQALTEWLHQGLQNAAGLPLARPLTFEDLWSAPCGPIDPVTQQNAAQSIRLFTLTSALSLGRAYKLPLNDPSARLFFRLSELQAYFPPEVMAHLARVSAPLRVRQDPVGQVFARRKKQLQHLPPGQANGPTLKKRWAQQLRHLQRLGQQRDAQGRINLRELPYGQLPVLVAARLSLSVPFLLDAIPMWAFDLENQTEDIALRRVWLSDGGMVSNFPIHTFDRALPRWPTFGVQIMDKSPSSDPAAQNQSADLPQDHAQGRHDVFLELPHIATAATTATVTASTEASARSGENGVLGFLWTIYATLMNAEDRSHLRMPDVRNRVLRIYTQGRLGGALNLKVKPQAIAQTARNGVLGGQMLAQAYVQSGPNASTGAWPWPDHRWVRLNLLVAQLRQYLSGFGAALHDQRMTGTSLLAQLQQAGQTPPLRSQDGAPLWSPAQIQQLLQDTQALAQLEHQLTHPNAHTPYQAQPSPVLKSKPDL